MLVLIAAHSIGTKPANAQQPAVLAHMFPDDSVANKAAIAFASRLGEEKSGWYNVEIIGNALLGDESHNVQQLANEEIQFAITGDALVSIILPDMAAVNLPFLYPDSATAIAAYDSWIGENIRKRLRPFGLELLSWHCIGQRMLTADRPVKGIGDLKDLKLRVPVNPVLTQAWRELGADTVNVPFPALADALRLGTVAAQENPASIIRSAKLYESQRYLMTSNHYTQFQLILASQEFLMSATPEDQQMVRDAAESVSKEICREALKTEREDIEWLLGKGGMELVNFDKAGLLLHVKVVAKSLSPTPSADLLDQLGLGDGD